MSNKMKIFLDKDGMAIQAGDVIKHEFYARMRERPEGRKVSIQSLSGKEVIVPDEGELLSANKHWVTYGVKWAGACLIAERLDYSDFQVLMSAELFNKDGERVHEGSGFHYFNNVFNSSKYKIVKST